jgi:uncharacterized membrane protein YdbT with pleckstrin-like domain
VAFNSKLLNEGEHVVVSTRTHPKALLVPVLVLIVALAVGVFFQGLGSGSGGEVMHITVWVLVAVAVLWFAVRRVIAWATTTYTFTNRRFMKRSGLIAKEGRTIPLNRISGVDFEIGLIDRVFGCGTLVVTDASEHGHVLLDDIPHVEEVQRTVSAELDRQAGHRADDGS